MTREWKAALLSLLGGPGMGQLYNREWKKGAALIGATLVMLAWVVVILVQSLTAALGGEPSTPEGVERAKQEAVRLMTPRLKAGVPVWTALWAYGVIDAFVAARRCGPPGPPGPSLALSVEEARAMDERATTAYGLPTLLLMENAGRAVAGAAMALHPGRVVAVCGGGSNGGDGLCAARHVLARGREAEAILLKPADRITGDAAVNLNALTKLGARITPLWEAAHRDEAAARAAGAGVIVDAVMGTGARGEPEGPALWAIEIINRSGRPVVAVDVPSGLNADTGHPAASGCVRAKVTVTLAAAKPGLLRPDAAPFVGRLEVADLGIPVEPHKG